MNNNEIILRNRLNQFNELSNTDFSLFLEICQYKEFKKKDLLLEYGKYNSGIFFVLSGSIGLFETINGKEMYQNFFLKNDFATELKSLSSQETSTKNLIALSDVSCFYIKRKELLSLYEKSIEFERLGRKLLEFLLGNQSEISNIVQSLKPEDRYQYLVKNKPELLETIPLTHIASFLGIARETLSRIRAKK